MRGILQDQRAHSVDTRRGGVWRERRSAGYGLCRIRGQPNAQKHDGEIREESAVEGMGTEMDRSIWRVARWAVYVEERTVEDDGG